MGCHHQSSWQRKPMEEGSGRRCGISDMDNEENIQSSIEDVVFQLVCEDAQGDEHPKTSDILKVWQGEKDGNTYFQFVMDGELSKYGSILRPDLAFGGGILNEDGLANTLFFVQGADKTEDIKVFVQKLKEPVEIHQGSAIPVKIDEILFEGGSELVAVDGKTVTFNLPSNFVNGELEFFTTEGSGYGNKPLQTINKDVCEKKEVTPTVTATSTVEITSTPTLTATLTPQPTETATPTLTSTSSPTPEVSPSVTSTNTPEASKTPSVTPTETKTHKDKTPTKTPTKTATASPSPTVSPISPEATPTVNIVLPPSGFGFEAGKKNDEMSLWALMAAGVVTIGAGAYFAARERFRTLAPIINTNRRKSVLDEVVENDENGENSRNKGGESRS